jgi:uncharacterized protein (TIGR02231 family)
MRNLILAATIFINLNVFAEERPVPVASHVDAVTVYLDRAVITRKASVKLSAGEQSVVFADLPPEIDEQSLRAAVNGSVRVENVQARKVYLAQAQEDAVRKLEAEAENFHRRFRELNDRKAGIERSQRFVDAAVQHMFAQVAGKDGAIPTRPTVEEYQGLLSFSEKNRTAQAADMRTLDDEIGKLQPQLHAKVSELEQLRAASRLERYEVTLVVTSPEAANSEILLSYMVPGALWVPVYDARADKDRHHVDIAYQALVQQATGEDWNNATLVLSAARPATTVQPPKPVPFYLQPHERSEQKLAQQEYSQSDQAYAPWANLRAQAGKRSSIALNEAQNCLIGSSVQVETVARAVERRSTTAIFSIAGRVSVPTNGKPQRVLILSSAVAMTTSLHAVPRVSLNCYVTGKAVNATESPFLPGAVSVFVGNDLIGTAQLEFTAPRETAELWMGVDESVKISRRLDEKNVSYRSFSKKKELELAYTIRAQSFHTEQVTVAIYESLPISQDERIEAELGRPDPKPAASDRGVTRWDIVLKPSVEHAISFSFSVVYAQDVVTPLLQDLERQVQEAGKA